MPKAVYHKNTSEVEFYQAIFDAVTGWTESSDEIVERGYHQAVAYGLAALDALHVAAAVILGADELVTTERSEKSIYRTSAVKVVSLWE